MSEMSGCCTVPDHGVTFRDPRCRGNDQVKHSGCVPTQTSMLDWADYCNFMAGMLRSACYLFTQLHCLSNLARCGTIYVTCWGLST